MNSMPNIRLGDVATVRSGLVLARKQARGRSTFRYPLLTLRALGTNNCIDLSQTDFFDASEQLDYDYLSHKGDVIIRLSAPYTPVLISPETADMVISSNFVIIRTNQNVLHPDYIFCLLNTPEIKRLIFRNTSSNMLGAIKPKFFSDFVISRLPPIEAQRQFAVLNKLLRQEATLLRRLATEKEKLAVHIGHQLI